MRVGQVVITVRIHFQIIEANERPFVVVVQDCRSVQRDRVDCGEVWRLIGPAVRYHVQLAIAIYTAVNIPCRWVGLDASQIVGFEVQEILPVVVAIVTLR